MSKYLVGKEPDPASAAVRAFFKNPGFSINYKNLSELRSAMINDDMNIVELLAKRKNRANAAQQEYLGMRNDVFPNGFARSFNLSHCLPYVYQEASRRHPYEEGLIDVLQQTYHQIATPESPPLQLYDYDLIDAIASRLNKAKQATVFKKDQAEGLAPKTQTDNIQRAVGFASLVMPEDPLFAQQVRGVYESLVPATVAVQQTMFARTYLLDDWDGLGFRGMDLTA